MKILCALAVREVVDPAAKTFSQSAGEPIDSLFGPVGALQKKIAAGESADLAILTRPMLETLQKAGTLTGCRDLCRIGVGVVMRDGAARPDLSTPDAFKQALLAARSIALTDPAVGGTAGIYVAQLMERMGLAEALKPKIRLQQNGFHVAQTVAKGEAELGMTQISEIVAVKGAAVAGPLPAPLQLVTTYAAGIFTASRKQDSALAFIERLTHGRLAGKWKAAGFEPPELNTT